MVIQVKLKGNNDNTAANGNCSRKTSPEWCSVNMACGNIACAIPIFIQIKSKEHVYLR